MPIISSIGNKIYGFASNLMRNITDNFNRTTTGNLGISSSGSLWQAIKGVWYANGTQAKSDDTASNNSIAVVPFGQQNVKVSAAVSSGTGLVFWLSDANSWWAATPHDTKSSTCPNGNCSGTQSLTGTRSCSCSSAICVRTCGCYSSQCTRNCSCTSQLSSCTRNCSCSMHWYYGFTYNQCASLEGTYSAGACGFLESNCASGNCSGTESYDCYQDVSNCTNGSCSGTENYACQVSNCDNGACSGTESFSCSSSTCNNGSCSGTENYNYDQACSCTYNYYLKIIKSVGGAVSTHGSNLSLTSAAVSLIVSTSGDAIQVKAYSDSNFTNLLATRNETPTSPTRGTSVGIIKTESGYNQGSTVDNFSAEMGV